MSLGHLSKHDRDMLQTTWCDMTKGLIKLWWTNELKSEYVYSSNEREGVHWLDGQHTRTKIASIIALTHDTTKCACE